MRGLPPRNVELDEEFLRRVWKDKISFTKLDLASPDKAPENPGAVLNDDIACSRAN